MQRQILNLATLALVLLPIIAPILGPVAAAQTLVGGKIVDTSGTLVDQTSASLTIGDYAVFQIYDANASTENITVTITVGGVDNNVDVGYVGDVGTYQGKISIEQAGQFVKVRYYYFDNATGEFIDMGYLNGSLNPHDTVIIYYKSPYSGQEVKITITYVPPPTKYYLEIVGRYYGGAYWIPRLGNCSILNTSMYYNGHEWRITSTQPFFNPGDTYTVVLSANNIATNAVVTSVEITFNATDNFTLVPINDTEAQKITAFVLALDTIAEPWYIEGNDFNAIQTIGDKLMLSAEVYHNGTLVGTTEPAEARLFVSIAQIEASPIGFNTPAITITIRDADANLDTLAAEHLPYPGALAPIMLLIQANTPVQMIEFDETGNNTGTFTATISIFDLYDLGIISETDNKIDYNFTEVRVDDPATTCICYRLGSFTANYNYANAYIAEQQVILRNVIQCCPPVKVTLMIEDTDLDLPGAAGTTVAIASIPANTMLYGAVAYYYYDDMLTNVPAVKFTVYLEDDAGNRYNLTTKADMNIYFEKQAPGVVKATIDLSKVNWQEVNRIATANKHKLTTLVIEVYDIFNPDLDPNKMMVLNTSLQNVSLSGDREVLPISFRIVGSTFNYGDQNATSPLASCPGCYPWINDTRGTAQVVHLTIVDPGANKNCCGRDTITVDKINISLCLIRPDGTKYTYISNANTGSIAIPLYAIETDGTWNRYGTCYIELSNLVETGDNTSTFTGTLRIYSEINVGGRTIRVAGCPAVWLENAILKLVYTSEAVGYSVYKIRFKTMDASLSVSSNVITYGDEVKITVEDPDANLDSQVNDSVMVEVSFYCPLTRGLVRQEVWLTETAPNSGVFTGTIYIDSRLADACNDLYCAPVDVIYVDRTPVDMNTIQYGLQQLDRNISLRGDIKGLMIFTECDCNKVQLTETMNYKPDKGTIKVYYSLPTAAIAPFNTSWIEVTGKVVPALLETQLKIVISDADLNRRVDQVDQLQLSHVAIEVPGATPGPIAFSNILGLTTVSETGLSTGTFEFSITLRQLFDSLKALGYIQVPAGMSDTEYYYALLSNLVATKEPLKIYYHDAQAACQAQVCGNVAPADIEVGVRLVDITGSIEIVDTVTGQPHNDSIYSCGCVIGNCPSATGDVIDIVVKDLSLLRYTSAGALRIVGNLTMQLSYNGTVKPLIYGNLNELRFDHYENMTIDGVVIPVPVFKATGVVIYCQQPLATTRPYIVAPVGSRVYFTYNDPMNATGLPDQVTTAIGIGVPGAARNITQAVQVPAEKLELRVFNGTAFVPTTVIQRGQPASIYVPLSYDPIVVRTFTGSDTFAVLMVLKDTSGKVYLFQYTYVTVGQNSVTFSLTSTNTESLQPGQYILEVYAVTNMDALVRMSPITQLTITIQ